MKKLNLPLILGIIIFLLLFIISLFPQAFTRIDPYSREEVIFSELENNRFTMERPPYPPHVRGPFGTDELGRDIYSQLIYGASVTFHLVLAAVLVRLIIALPIGIHAGFGGSCSGWLLKLTSSLFTTIPALIFSMVLLSLPAIKELPREISIYAFALVISVVEWGRLGSLIDHQVKDILQQPFIEGAVVMGKSPLQITLSNVLPHLVPHLLVFVSLEAGRVLFMLCQLGVFGFVLGNLTYDWETMEELSRNISYEPEWAAMLGTAVKRFKTYPWIAFPPMGAFFIGILGFNLMGEGLRIEFEKKSSRFISWIKRLPRYLSPRLLIYDIKRIPVRPAPGLVKLTLLLGTILIVFFPSHWFYHAFDGTQAFRHTAELSSEPYEGRRSGTAGRDKAAQYLASELEKAGLQPGGEDGGFFHTFELPETQRLTRQRLSILDSNGQWKELTPYVDYRVVNAYPVRFADSLYKQDGTLMDEVIIVDSLHMGANTGYRDLLQQAGRKGTKLIFYIRHESIRQKTMEPPPWYHGEPFTIVEVTPELGELLLHRDIQVEIETAAEALDKPIGRNVIALLPGKNPVLEDQFIVIGANYDGVGDEEGLRYPGAVQNASASGLSLELAKSLAKKGAPERTIVFAFWDYSERPSNGADAYGMNPSADILMHTGVLYLDLKYLAASSHREVYLDTSRNPPTTPDTQRMVKYLRESLMDLGFRITNKTVFSEESRAMQYRGLGCIVLQSPLSEFPLTPGDTPENVHAGNLKNLGQALVNALIRIAY